MDGRTDTQKYIQRWCIKKTNVNSSVTAHASRSDQNLPSPHTPTPHHCSPSQQTDQRHQAPAPTSDTELGTRSGIAIAGQCQGHSAGLEKKQYQYGWMSDEQNTCTSELTVWLFVKLPAQSKTGVYFTFPFPKQEQQEPSHNFWLVVEALHIGCRGYVVAGFKPHQMEDDLICFFQNGRRPQFLSNKNNF